MDSEEKDDRRYGYVMVLLGSLLAALNTGYAAFSANHEEYFAQAFREYYPNFALNDWYVWENVHFHVAFTKLLLVLLHLGLAKVGLCAIWIGCVLWQFRNFQSMIVACGGREWHLGLFILLWIGVGPDGAGETRSVEGFLVPSMLGFTFMLAAVERLLKEKPYQAAVCAGAAGLFHIAFAVVGFPVLLAAMLAGPREKLSARKLAVTVVLALLAASPTLIWTALHTGVSERGLEHIFMLRAPHHMDPTFFPRRTWLVTIGVMLLGMLVPAAEAPAEKTACRQLKAVVLSISVILAVSFASFVLGGPEALVRIVPWRFTAFAMLASYVLLSASGGRRLWPGLAASAIPLGTAIFGIPWTQAVGGCLVVAVGWSLAHYKPAVKKWLPVSLAFCLLWTLKGDVITSPHYFTLKTQLPAAEWFQDHTPPGSIVLTPPDQVTFRVLSHRAAYNTFKCFSVLNRKLSDMWLERLKKEAGLDPKAPFPVPFRGYYLEWFLEGRFMNLPPEYLDQLARENGCNYILLPRLRMVLTVDEQGARLTAGRLNPAIPPGLQRLGWEKLYEDGEYMIYGRRS